MILQLLRCFDDEGDSIITHVDGSVDPLRDLETIETEASAREVSRKPTESKMMLSLRRNSDLELIKTFVSNRCLHYHVYHEPSSIH